MKVWKTGGKLRSSRLGDSFQVSKPTGEMSFRLDLGRVEGEMGGRRK